jgi:hypothetical protein
MAARPTGSIRAAKARGTSQKETAIETLATAMTTATAGPPGTREYIWLKIIRI